MPSSALQHLASANHWAAIWPEAGLGCLALALLVLEIALPKGAQRLIPGISIAGQAAILVAVAAASMGGASVGEAFGGLLRISSAGQAMRIFFLLTSLFSCLIARGVLERQAAPRVEFHHIVLVVTAALMLLAESRHFVMLFVALETVTIGFYVLVSYTRANAASLEAGLKYLVMGALSSALLLFGIVLLYGAAGNPLLPGHTAEGLSYGALEGFLAANPHQFLPAAGIALVLSGIAFKVGAFPFQIWIPDVYQGAPTPVTALLAVGSKAAGFVVLLTLATTVFAPYAWLVTPALACMAAATILFGNVAALTQHNVKRLIGLSGVSHAGFLLLGVVAAARAPLAEGAVYFYLFTYLLGTLAVFGVMAHLAGPDDSDQDLAHYAGLYRQNPFLAGVLAVGLGSLAGIPPLAGFMGKFLVFVAAYQAGRYGLLAVAVSGVVLSIYYYFGWIRAAFFDPAPARPRETTPVTPLARFALLALALGSIALGFYQGPLGRWLSGR
jgi:NADH-quinone oxidoreductase subunit N